IVSRLPEDFRRIADLAKRLKGEFRVDTFCFLQAQRVRTIRLDPIKRLWSPNCYRINIPGCDFHKWRVAGYRAAPMPRMSTLPNKIGFVKPLTHPGSGAKKTENFVQLLRFKVD